MKKLLFTALLTLMIAPGLLAGDGKFFRFEMTETESNGTPTEIKVRVPLSIVGAMTSQIEEAFEQVDFEGQELNIKELWAEVRAAGDNDFIEIDKEGAHIKVSTEGDFLLVSVEENESDQTINVKVPLSLGDLLFAEGGPDVDGILEELSNFTDVELFTIESEKVNAKAWIE